MISHAELNDRLPSVRRFRESGFGVEIGLFRSGIWLLELGIELYLPFSSISDATDTKGSMLPS